VTEALRRTADPTIFVTVESLRQEKEAIERNVPEWRKTIAKARRWREQFAKWADPDCPGANMAFGGEWFPAWHPGMSYANVQADCRDALRGEQRTKAEENVKQAEEDAARAQKLLDDAPARIESIQQRMKELLAKAMLPESGNWDAD